MPPKFNNAVTGENRIAYIESSDAVFAFDQKLADTSKVQFF
jgi:hypothetical protein